MPGSRLEAAVSGLVARARLYERVLHDTRTWDARVQGSDCSVFLPLIRHECEDRIVMVGYLHAPVQSVTVVEIWSGNDMVQCYPVDPPQDGPFRVSFCVAAEDAELAA
jgi:hypothetical protein